MSPRLTGWAFVTAQVALIVALVMLPGRDDWPTPTWLRAVGNGLLIAGFGVIGIASLRLGSSLTPTPVPTAHGSLTTTGLYRYVRHPIYTGVLIIVFALTIRSGSLITLAVAVVTIGFFHVKARWEEQQLATRYPDYEAYAARTSRFFPRPWG